MAKLKTYEVEIAELQTWRIYILVKAKDDEEAKKKAETGDYESVISAKMKDVDHKEILEVEEVES